MNSSTTTLLAALRGHLIDSALVRRPDASGTLPPLHLEPHDGPLAPGARADPADADATRETAGDLVVTLRLSSEPARGLVDLTTRVAVIDFVYRSKGGVGLLAGRRLHDAIISELVLPAGFGQGLAINPSGDPDPNHANPRVWAVAIDSFGGLGPVDTRTDGVHTDLAKIAVEWLRQ